MKEDLKQQAEEKEKQVDKTAPAKPLDLTKMFEFSDLEQLERLAHVLGSYYDGKNDVYKDEKKNRFYLIVHKSQHAPEEVERCTIFGGSFKLNPVHPAMYLPIIFPLTKVLSLGCLYLWKNLVLYFLYHLL